MEGEDSNCGNDKVLPTGKKVKGRPEKVIYLREAIKDTWKQWTSEKKKIKDMWKQWTAGKKKKKTSLKRQVSLQYVCAFYVNYSSTNKFKKHDGKKSWFYYFYMSHMISWSC